MSRYKIEANSSVYIRSLDKRLHNGDKEIIDSPSDTVLNELEKFSNIGELRYVELVEKKADTYSHTDEEESTEEEDDNEESLEETSEEDDEFIIEDETYYCEICGRDHYTDSSIGKEHLKNFLENEEDKN